MFVILDSELFWNAGEQHSEVLLNAWPKFPPKYRYPALIRWCTHCCFHILLLSGCDCYFFSCYCDWYNMTQLNCGSKITEVIMLRKKKKAEMWLECGTRCTNLQTQQLVKNISVNSFTNMCVAGGSGGPGDYKANLRTDRGHLCPQRPPGITDPHCANEGSTTGCGQHMPPSWPTPFSLKWALIPDKLKNEYDKFWFFHIGAAVLLHFPWGVDEKRENLSVAFTGCCAITLGCVLHLRD